MKFISLFTKTPNYKRFSYNPRFYDPKEDERKEREERIKKEIEREKTGETGDYRSRMSGSFQSARRRKASSESRQSTFIRLGVLLFLSLFLIAFLTWGRPVLYSLLVVFPVYIYIKYRNLEKKSTGNPE